MNFSKSKWNLLNLISTVEIQKLKSLKNTNNEFIIIMETKHSAQDVFFLKKKKKKVYKHF